MPAISIGMPLYNGERYLPTAIDSLLAQTFEDFELNICDNGSTDRTQEICRDYAQREPRIHYVRNQQNIGAAGNFAQVFETRHGPLFSLVKRGRLLCADVFGKDQGRARHQGRALLQQG